MDVDTIAGNDSSHPRASRIRWGETAAVAVILLLFFLVAVHAARLRPFWFDELSTLFMSATPSISALLRASPTDGNPPLYFLLARLSLHLPLKTELALRLPAILAYLGAALTVYLFVRRDAGRSYAFLALSLFLGCGFHSYAVEARSYALLLAFTGLGVICWQSYARTGRPRALIGMAFSIVGAILTHQYGIIYAMLPLALGETVRSVRRRAVDWKAALAITVPLCTILLTYPVMLRAQRPLIAAIRACPVFFAHPQASDLKEYSMAAPPFFWLPMLLVCFGAVVAVAVSRHKAAETAADVPPEDLAVAVTLSLFLPIMLLATHLGTNFFERRYGIGSALGIAMFAGLLLAKSRWSHATALAWTGVAYSLAIGMLAMWGASNSVSLNSWSDPVLQAGGASEPIVVASALEYPPMWWYGGAALRGRLHYLEDLSYAKQQSDLVPEYSLALEHQYTPMQMEDYRTFLAGHRHFLLYCYGEPRLEWIKARLQQDGWHLTLLRSAPQHLPEGSPSDYRELFLVSR